MMIGVVAYSITSFFVFVFRHYAGAEAEEERIRRGLEFDHRLLSFRFIDTDGRRCCLRFDLRNNRESGARERESGSEPSLCYHFSFALFSLLPVASETNFLFYFFFRSLFPPSASRSGRSRLSRPFSTLLRVIG